MNYAGPERRRHRIIVTKNTEYHLREGRVVAVRQAQSGEWVQNHSAIGAKVVGSFASTGVNAGDADIEIGARVFLEGDILTSPIERIRRPSIDTMMVYQAA